MSLQRKDVSVMEVLLISLACTIKLFTAIIISVL